MRYVSTRGEAPPLGFVDVTLAGLARDGGLYVPETWPRSTRQTDRRLCRPALRRGRGRGDPAVRRRRHRRSRSRAHGARGLRHLPPSGGRAARPDRPQPLRARAVPRPDARLQGRGDAAAGAADGPRARQARRAHHHRGRDLRRHRRRRGRGVPRPRARRPLRAVPARPHLRRAAAADDDGARRQRPRDRDRRHLRRLPGAGEGAVQPSRLPRPRAALRRQLDQLGAHRRAGGLLLHRRGRARRAAPQGRLHGADRQFRRRLRRLRRAAHGPADRPPGDRHQRQRHPGAHACDRRLRDRATWWRPRRRRWTSRCRRISSGCCSRPTAATPRGARADGLARAVAALRGRRAGAAKICARCSPPIAPTKRRPPPPSAPPCARPATASIRTPPSALPSPRRKRAIRRCR